METHSSHHEEKEHVSNDGNIQTGEEVSVEVKNKKQTIDTEKGKVVKEQVEENEEVNQDTYNKQEYSTEGGSSVSVEGTKEHAQKVQQNRKKKTEKVEKIDVD